MERPIDLLNYTAVDRDFFEPYGKRSIDEKDFVDTLRTTVPADWSTQRSGIWMQCTPPGARLPTQGWKIHVSSIPSTARIVLMITAAALVASGTAFKFAADGRMLAAVNGKRWPRGGSGKFITVYPKDSVEFRRIIEDLHAILSGYAGPYVLSDRRYRDSQVLYYRYGGIQGESRASASGNMEWVIRRPDGEMEPDDRRPRFRVPEWLRDPFAEANPLPAPASADLGGGRYRVISAITFSSAGGVYLAEDLDEGRRVIIKEARPHIGGQAAATAMLRKEFRILRKLAPLHVTPQPIACFDEWENSYLVEEFVDGMTLRLWLGRRYPWLKVRASPLDVATYLREVGDVFTALAEALAAVHATGISLGDLSFHNCMVTPDNKVRLIDLEAAIEHGVDATLDMRTPGFASATPDRRTLADACAEDAYAFGANLFAAITPVNAMLSLDPHAATRFTRGMCRDMGYPEPLVDIIGSLLDTDPGRRPSPSAAMALFLACTASLASEVRAGPMRHASQRESSDPAGHLFRYIENQAQHARADRYVPAGPEVFESHPWGVAHGAAGVLHAYIRGGRVPPAGLVDYLVDGIGQARNLGSNLMHGAAGMAWVLFEAGHTDRAAGMLRGKPVDGALRRQAGLHEGLAGWGLARIKAWHETAEPAFLDDAIVIAAELLATAMADGDTLHWKHAAYVPIGLGHGASGVALFLLHIAEATGEARFHQAARRALAYDLAQQGSHPDGQAAWPKLRGHGTLFPYLRHGTAGVLAVVARFYACTGEARYRDVVLRAEMDIMRRHAISPGLFYGLAGLGETLLDLATFLPDRALIYRDAANAVAGGIDYFLMQRPEGLAVPGAELLRISCDFATGNAGVGAFFDRLHQGAAASFMLDERLPIMHSQKALTTP